MTSATPKPRAGEHYTADQTESPYDALRLCAIERDALRERERELVEALRALTFIGESPQGVIVGPRGWEMVQAALAKARP